MRGLSVLALGSLVAAASGTIAAGEVSKRVEALAALVESRGYTEAAESGRALLATLEAEGGGDSLEAAVVLDLLVEAAWRGGLADAGRAEGERAVAIRQRLLGPEDATVAKSLHLLGNLVFARGDAAAARAYYERSLAIREKAFGPESAEVVPSLNNLGNVTRTLGDLEASRRVLERALAIREKILPPTSRDLVRSHVSLGNTLGDLGRLEDAERQLRRAVEILDGQGAKDQQLSSALNTLFAVLERQGRYAEAEAAVRRAVEVERQAAGNTPFAAMYLGNLAVLRRDRGDLADARRLQEEALRIEEAAPSEDPTSRALLLNNLGYLFLLMGDPAGAQPVLERALEARRRVLPADHPLIAQTLQNLGHVHLSRREIEDARRLYEAAVGILERTVGKSHRDYGEALLDLASASRAQGRMVEARDHFARGLATLRDSVGGGTLMAAKAQFFLAESRFVLGEVAAARQGFEEALATLKASLGPKHPAVAEALVLLSQTLARSGETARAFDAALEAEELRIELARSTLPVLPHRQALAFAANPGGLHVALSLTTRRRDGASVERAWDTLIRSRGLTLEEMIRRARFASEPPDDRAASIAADLDDARGRLVQLLLRPAVAPEAAGARRALDDVRRETERLEQALAEASAGLPGGLESRSAGLSSIRAALPPGTALVAYVHYRDRLAGTNGRDSRAGEPGAYCAFVLAGRDAPPRVVPLGPAAAIDALVAAWRREVTFPALAGPRKGAEARYRVAAQALHDAVWAPLEAHFANAEAVFVVPDGSLQLIGFASLPASRSRYLAEVGPRLHLLTSERDLIRRSEAAGRGLLALAAPDFDADPTSTAGEAEIAAAPAGAVTDVKRLRSALGRAGSAERFAALPASGEEMLRVTSLWRKAAGDPDAAIGFGGPAASERAFKTAAPGRRILHLATHGFFLSPEGAPPEEYGSRVLARWSAWDARYLSPDNPLLTSGLALAGANRALAGEAASPANDGLLLAEEVAAVDLRGVEWVVLSACETGLGELVPGEGVAGLRRAVLAGGARTVIMSLWRVQDDATAEWMEALYRARLERGDSTIGAMTNANRAVLASRRRSKRSTHPFYWAAFVAAGDWR